MRRKTSSTRQSKADFAPTHATARFAAAGGEEPGLEEFAGDETAAAGSGGGRNGDNGEGDAVEEPEEDDDRAAARRTIAAMVEAQAGRENVTFNAQAMEDEVVAIEVVRDELALLGKMFAGDGELRFSEKERAAIARIIIAGEDRLTGALRLLDVDAVH